MTRVQEVDMETGETIEKVCASTGFDDSVEARFTDAINNTRNAFDQMLFAACTAIRRPIKDGHWPWACSPTDLEWKFKNKKTGKEHIPHELWDVLAAQEPYPRTDTDTHGDTLVRAMATLANSKHTVGIEIRCNVGPMFFSKITRTGGEYGMKMGKTVWDPVKNEVELFRWKGGKIEFGGDQSVALEISFDTSVPEPLSGYRPGFAINAFIQAAQRALDAMKARALELGAE